MERSISFERTVAVDYAAAVAALREQPGDLVLDDEETSTLVLHAEVAGFDVARRVTVTIEDVEEVDKHAVKLPVSWEATEKPKRFPTFDGGIEVSAMSEHPVQSQVALIGTVEAPLGILGTVGEAAGGTDIGDAVLRSLLDRIIARLQALVAERQASAAAEMTPAHMSRPRFSAED